MGRGKKGECMSEGKEGRCQSNWKERRRRGRYKRRGRDINERGKCELRKGRVGLIYEKGREKEEMSGI